MAKIVQELSWGIESFLAFIALISSSVFEAAERAGSNYIAISKPKITVLTITLHHFFLVNLIVFMDIQENLLGNT